MRPVGHMQPFATILAALTRILIEFCNIVQLPMFFSKVGKWLCFTSVMSFYGYCILCTGCECMVTVNFITADVEVNGRQQRKKRKLVDEQRVFQDKWELPFFCTIVSGKIHCLTCNSCIATPKEYNLRRHYEANHKSYKQYEGHMRVVLTVPTENHPKCHYKP